MVSVARALTKTLHALERVGQILLESRRTLCSIHLQTVQSDARVCEDLGERVAVLVSGQVEQLASPCIFWSGRQVGDNEVSELLTASRFGGPTYIVRAVGGRGE